MKWWSLLLQGHDGVDRVFSVFEIPIYTCIDFYYSARHPVVRKLVRICGRRSFVHETTRLTFLCS